MRKKIDRKYQEDLKRELRNKRRGRVLEEEEEKVSIEDMLEDLKKIKTKKELEEYLEIVHSVDIAAALEELSDDEVLKLFELMTDENKAEIFENSNIELQERLVNLIDDDTILDMFSLMSPDDIADVLGYIDFYKSKALLNQMKRSEANKLRELLGYEEDSAGGLMTTQYIAFKKNLKVQDVMFRIKNIAPKTEYMETIFVLNEQKELVGEADLRDILIAPDEEVLENLMEENVMSVYPEVDQEEVAFLVSKYGLKVVPVINKRKNMLGIITVDDIIDVIQEENTEDMLKLGGVSEEESANSPLFFSIRKRLPWLALNLCAAFFASFIVGLFQDVISQAVVLATAMPIVAGTGGNAGTQTLAVTIRGIALGELDVENSYKIIIKQLFMGLINGAALGLVAGTMLSFFNQNIYLGVIIFLAMVFNLTLACLIGFLVPTTLKKLKIDPALASAVVLTAFTDIFGFLIFLGLASFFIHKL